jgi:DNA-binding NarL/FixJ family response regulator
MNVIPATRSVLLADDHPLVLKGLGDAVATDPTFYVVGAASDGEQALALARRHCPNLAVIDLAMPGLNGLEVARAIATEGLPVRVILLTALISDAQIVSALAAGIWGILLKESALDELIDCLHAVAGGNKWFPEALVEQALSRHAQTTRRENAIQTLLTMREREVVALVCQGHSNNLIAEELGLSPGTVRIHLHNIYMKLDVKNRTQLAAMVLTDHTA